MQSIITIQQVYGVDSVKEFEKLVTGLGWELQSAGLYTLVRWTKEANIEVRPSLKGLIYEWETGKICAPGVLIPIEPEQKGDAAIVGYSPALDGVMIRFWVGVGGLMWSTNGAITAGTWREQDLTLMLMLLLEIQEDKPESQFNNFFKLFHSCKQGLCYFAILEHPDLPNIYKPAEPRLTLVRVMDTQGNTYPLDESIFKYVNHITPTSTISSAILAPEMFWAGYVGPATRDTYGELVYLDNGAVYRVLSEPAKAAERVRPNFRELWQHWIYNVRETQGPEDWKDLDSKLSVYKTYFPWNADVMDGLSAFFDYHVDQEVQTEVLKSNRKLREIVDSYYFLLEQAGTYYVSEDGTACTKILGDYPDTESADHHIDWLLEKPVRLIEFLSM